MLSKEQFLLSLLLLFCFPVFFPGKASDASVESLNRAQLKDAAAHVGIAPSVKPLKPLVESLTPKKISPLIEESQDVEEVRGLAVTASYDALSSWEELATEPDCIPVRVLIGIQPLTSNEMLWAEDFVVVEDGANHFVVDHPFTLSDLAEQTTTQVVGLQPGGDFIFFGRWYRGTLLVDFEQSPAVKIVNETCLEDYLTSVVGAEMPSSWEMDALIAQAIAARSYAVYHINRNPQALYHLGNDERWQVYRGVDSESDRAWDAIAQSAGLVMLRSGHIAETMYASTPEVTSTAHAGFESMPQTSAQALAMQGWDWLSILKRFYSAELGLLE
ncbi:SpoIID/LytB domain-containing protein [Leptolyngbya sp. AN02str]|uniref:SpoIID/LytB domain-containing protein n=1 Tax=Leptolyngbya sp. AN02str TaxID=3423363 RepID=UPI003D31B502